MTINLPYKVRAALYILAGISGPVVIYLAATGQMSDAAVACYGGLMVFIAGLAGFNINKD